MLGPLDLTAKAIELETFGASYDPAGVARTLRAAAATVAFVNGVNDGLQETCRALIGEIEALKLQLAQESAERVAAQRRLIPHAIAAKKKQSHPTTRSKRTKKEQKK